MQYQSRRADPPDRRADRGGARAFVELHPHLAERLGIADGERVTVSHPARAGLAGRAGHRHDPPGHRLRAVPLGRQAARQHPHQRRARPGLADAGVQGLRRPARPARRGGPVTRVVVVGNGMAGARSSTSCCAATGASRSPSSAPSSSRPTTGSCCPTCSPGSAGTATSSCRLVDGAVRRLGAEVVAIDRGARTVTVADGAAHAYDALVLATGSTPVVPPVHGIAGPAGKLLDGVLRLPHPRRLRRHRRARRAGDAGGRRRRRPARARGGPRAAAARAAASTSCTAWATSWTCSSTRSAARSCAARSSGSASACTSARSPVGSPAAAASPAWASPTAAHVDGDLVVLACGVRPEVDLARRRRPRRRARRRRRRRAAHQTTRPSTRSASAPSTAVRCTAWSRPPGSRPRSSPTC